MSKTVLITGSSSGIGRATARLFQNKGWNVVATMRNPTAETELSGHPNTLVTRLDVQDWDSIDTAIAAGSARFGGIDVLVNNAGYGAYGPLEATPLARIRNQFEVNVIGVLATTRAILPHFRARHSGVVVNLSSMGGKITFPLGSLYHGSKFAVEGLSEALQYELAAIGVRVKIIEPGAIKTDFAGRSFDFNNDPAMAEYQPVVQAVFAALGPMAENAAPADIVAEAIFGAATDESPQLRHVVGQDAAHLLAARAAADDQTFMAGMRANMGLGA